MYSILARDCILSTPWLKLFKERVQANDGTQADYYIAERGDAVVVVATTPDNKIVLINEYKHGIRDRIWQLPAGHVEPGQSLETAARRELAEETGYNGGTFKTLSTWHSAPHWSPGRVFLCVIENVSLESTPQTEPTEDITLRVVPIPQAFRMARAGKIQCPFSALALFLYQQTWQPPALKFHLGAFLFSFLPISFIVGALFHRLLGGPLAYAITLMLSLLLAWGITIFAGPYDD